MRHLINAIVLAAGKSKRFKGQPSKLITHICGQEMILYPIKVLAELNLNTTIVTGHLESKIKSVINRLKSKNIKFIRQENPLGTGHAVACTKSVWSNPLVLVLNGDTPLINSDLICELVKTHKKTNADVSIVTSFVTTPTGYGRIIEDEKGIRIVEEKDCSPAQRFTGKVNAGIYLFSKEFLLAHIDGLSDNNASGEFYLTDLIKIANDKNLNINLVSRPYDEVRGVNNLEELWAVEQIKRSELMRQLMHQGVRFELAQTIHIDANVEIGDGSFIGNCALILGNTKIGKNCQIMASTIIDNAIIGDNTVIHSHSIIKNSQIGQKCNVGPFANIQEKSVLEDGASVDNFVDIRRSKLCTGCHSQSLTHLSDTIIGAKTNIGAGCISCNYETDKHQTIVGEEAAIGANTTLVAPVIMTRKSKLTPGTTLSHGTQPKSESPRKTPSCEKVLLKAKQSSM